MSQTNNNTIPKYLYHYTTVDTLRAIVENKTIRFTRLDKLNDPIEGMIGINNNGTKIDLIMKYAYCSCWSNVEDESVAMWNLYAQNIGVRIKFRYDMFLKDNAAMNLKEMYDCVYPVTPIDEINIGNIGNKELPCCIDKIYGPIRIIYEKSIETINNKVTDRTLENDENVKFVMNDIFLLKKAFMKINHWKYEEEYRFVLCPFIEIHGSESITGQINSINTTSFPDIIDIPLQKQIEEVVFGPRMSEIDKHTLRLFLYDKGIINVRNSQVRI